MTVAAGSVGELYIDQDTKAPLGAPPAAPSDVPPPVAPVKVEQPVVVKSRMADETPDGRIRDTSTEALRQGNELGYRNLDADPKTPAEEPKPEVGNTPQAAPEAPPAPPRVYAGKFKSIEELERGYEESQKAMHKAFEEKANIERQHVAQAAAPPKPVEKTQEQVVSEQQRAQQRLNEFVSDPDKFVGDIYQKANQQTMIALKAQEMHQKWAKDNPDLVAGEIYVAADAWRLAQSDPNLANDPQGLYDKSTANFRDFLGKIRMDAQKEALTQETRVIPLASTPPTPTATEQPATRALSSDDAFDAHMKMLKAAERRSKTGLRR
jgi:hypothetical protein